jgi:uncharacterized protein (TIGR03435 family)
MKGLRTAGLIALISCCAVAHAQRPAFEVAVVKRNNSGTTYASSLSTPGRVTISNETLRNIIRSAYGNHDLQVLGGPSWIDGERWDINAGVGADNQGGSIRPLMQSLLAERFKLVAHVETRELPIYALVMAHANRQLGPRLHGATIECSIQGTGCGSHTTQGMITSTAQTMVQTAVNLTQFAGRRVVDKTGLTGRFDFTLTWTPEGGASLTDADGGSLFTALQDQLGLKLESQRGPVEVVVIDSVERAVQDP